MRVELPSVSWEEYYDDRLPCEYHRPTGRLKAFCNSSYCYPKGQSTVTTNYGVVKPEAKIHDVFCKDCSAALYWTREVNPSHRNYIVVAEKSSKYIRENHNAGRGRR